MTSNSSSACRTSSPFDNSSCPLAAAVSEATPWAPSHADNGARRLWSRSRGLLTREDFGGNVKDLRNSRWREAWVVACDLVPGHALRQTFEHKAYAEARAANARLPTKGVGILYYPTHPKIVAGVRVTDVVRRCLGFSWGALCRFPVVAFRRLALEARYRPVVLRPVRQPQVRWKGV